MCQRVRKIRKFIEQPVQGKRMRDPSPDNGSNKHL
jgi:hypothetical protein